MKEGRRKFLWQVSSGLVGLAGLSRLAKAMTEQETSTVSNEPCSPGPWECQPKYTCDKFAGITCQERFNCILTFTCGPNWFGDFKCEQLEFSCGTFKCETFVGEPGAQFHCMANFSHCRDFTCNPGDFSCKIPDHYKCLKGESAYSCSASPSAGTLSAYATPIVPPEP